MTKEVYLENAILKLINIIHYINRMKKKNHIIVLLKSNTCSSVVVFLI